MKYKYGDLYTESTLYMYSMRRVIMYNCHLAWWSGAIQRMLSSNIHWNVLYPAEQEEAWNFKTSFKQRQSHLLVWINRGMNEKAWQDLETNIRSADKSVYDRSRSMHYIPRGERDVIRLRNPTEDVLYLQLLELSYFRFSSYQLRIHPCFKSFVLW